jgi:hypothetical protein
MGATWELLNLLLAASRAGRSAAGLQERTDSRAANA